MKKITEAQLRKIIRNELNEIFGFGNLFGLGGPKKPKRLKTVSPHGDKMAALMASSGWISIAYDKIMKAKKENNKMEEQKAFIELGNAITKHMDKISIELENYDEEAHSSRFFE